MKNKMMVYICLFAFSSLSYAESMDNEAVESFPHPMTATKQDPMVQDDNQSAVDPCEGIENCSVAVPCEGHPEADSCYSPPLHPEIPGAGAYATNP